MDEHTIDTASGRKIDLDRPDPDQIALEDIAGGLSKVCRFGAQAVRFHSVAEHAVLVCSLVSQDGRPDLGLAALHHDSHEAYVCDVPAPLKAKMRREGQTVYESICDALDKAIFGALRIPPLSDDERTIIKDADKRALMIEAAALLPDEGAGISASIGQPVRAPGALGSSLDPERARQQFLHIHEALLRSAKTVT